MIGTIDLRLNEAHRQAEIGYVLNKRYWGQGIMPEAAQAILAVGFDQLQLVRIFSEHDTRNPKSGRVMTKIGMQQEGVALKSQIIKGEIVDMVHYAITDTQYKMLQQAKKVTGNPVTFWLINIFCVVVDFPRSGHINVIVVQVAMQVVDFMLENDSRIIT